MKRIGVVDEERPANALSMRKTNEKKTCLSGIVIGIGRVDEERIRRAVEEQTRGGGTQRD